MPSSHQTAKSAVQCEQLNKTRQQQLTDLAHSRLQFEASPAQLNERNCLPPSPHSMLKKLPYFTFLPLTSKRPLGNSPFEMWPIGEMNLQTENIRASFSCFHRTQLLWMSSGLKLDPSTYRCFKKLGKLLQVPIKPLHKSS